MRLAILIAITTALPAGAADRPNILWLVGEDANVTWFGCYGNPNAKTPNIDKLAEEGHRYAHAYANAPVCAPSRSTWITGTYAVSTGTHNMRSRYAIPHEQFSYYPDQLRKAGYYCANHTKTDYNIGGRDDKACWDSETATAWKSRKPGQPFFQVINFNESHESKAFGDVTKTQHSPGETTLTKYHPDDLTIRQNYAKYHDAVAKMDAQVGKALAELVKAGLADDTIVIFCTDHGGVLPRSKRFLYESGLHCPLIIRVPEKFKQFRPAAKPGVVDRLVNFIDMPKTWLSLCGATIPAHMQGRIFLGPRRRERTRIRLRLSQPHGRADRQPAFRARQALCLHPQLSADGGERPAPRLFMENGRDAKMGRVGQGRQDRRRDRAILPPQGGRRNFMTWRPTPTTS